MCYHILTPFTKCDHRIPRKRRFSKSPNTDIVRRVSRRRSSVHRSLSSTLSETLHSLLPSSEECRRVCDSAKFLPCLFQQMLTRKWKTTSRSSEYIVITPNKMAELPTASVHPVLLAQKMLMLACLTQFTPQEKSFDGWWSDRVEHMAAAAIDVIAKEELCHNAEGLECLMLEATYHANSGSMRRAFATVRRAMALGQLLGIYRGHQVSIVQLDKNNSPFNPTYMWSQVVMADRLFSLVLALPQGYSSAQNAHAVTNILGDDPEEQLERQHSEIASWILDRNERGLDDRLATQNIDQALESATSLLPSTWWLPANLLRINSRRDMFLSATRLVHHIHHFNLINQTHLPYIHRPGVLFAYNKLTCATASREILQRYLALQDSSVVAHTSHIIEFFSLIAAMTLVLVHLERLWQDDSQELSVLAHTRSGDRAMIEKTITHMARLPTCKGPQILQHLLEVEEEAFRTRSVGSGTIVKGFTDQDPFFELKIPYFGRLRLNSMKICFKRQAEIDEISVSVKNNSYGPHMENFSGLDDLSFDLRAFINDVETFEEGLEPDLTFLA